VSEPDRGQAHAINKWVQRASGEILGWLNSDDLYLPGTIMAAAQRFASSVEVSIVSGFRWDYYSSTGRLLPSACPYPTEYVLRRVCIVPQETVFFRRLIVEKAGLLDTSFQHCLDWEYWNRLLTTGYRFSMIGRFQAVYRRHPLAKTSTQFALHEIEKRRIYRKYLGRDISPAEAKRELGLRWWFVYRLIRTAGRLGLMSNQDRAELILSLGLVISGGR
jgi:GT2 family glycosyltransferase